MLEAYLAGGCLFPKLLTFEPKVVKKVHPGAERSILRSEGSSSSLWSNGIYPRTKNALLEKVETHPGALKAHPGALEDHLDHCGSSWRCRGSTWRQSCTSEPWRVTLELWRLTLELWRLTQELWRHALELWRLFVLNFEVRFEK